VLSRCSTTVTTATTTASTTTTTTAITAATTTTTANTGLPQSGCQITPTVTILRFLFLFLSAINAC
jgi:hypothetical protein